MNQKLKRQLQSEYDRTANKYNKAIKNELILFTNQVNFFLFEYHKRRYITRDDFLDEIFLFQKKPNPTFIIDESLQLNGPLLDILYKKHGHAIDNGQTLLYEDLENESIEISKRRLQHLEVIRALNNLNVK